METKYGFTKLTPGEFKDWITELAVNRAVFYIQEHHTYSPGKTDFKGNNHFNMQQSMKNYHVIHNGWEDIAQHFSIFPDGVILTGRSIERSPAGIKGHNANAICIENVGNFDLGGDNMEDIQKNSIIGTTAALCIKFNIPVNTDKILYHHWFNLNTGERNNGTGNNKSCPGSNFFGGNKVSDCENNFLPLIQSIINNTAPAPASGQIQKYVCVTANYLNVRLGPGINFSKASGIESVKLGTILQVYDEKNGWYKINDSLEYWISGKYTSDVKKGVINTNDLNIRTGPGTDYLIVGKFHLGQEVFVESEKNGWLKLCIEDKWIKKEYVSL